MADIHVGSPPNEWESWESHVVHFHSFESMSTEKGYCVKSPKFSCCNHEWRLKMCPGGSKNSDDGMMSLHLVHCSGPEISAKCYDSGKVFHEQKSPGYYKFPRGEYKSWGLIDFVERAGFVDPANKFLKHGSLTIEVRIKPDDDHCCTNFIPKNGFTQDMLQSFMDEDTADVVFEVTGQVGGAEDEPPSVKFHAHKFVLQFRAKKSSTLASLCEECDKSTPVPIRDIDPQVFRQMLYYVYGGNIAAAGWKAHSKDLIEAADRYGVKNLKIEAEAWYVKHLKLKITVDNVVDTLAFSDEKNCFLLKEAATDFILKNTNDVLASDSFQSIPKSTNVISEILSVASMNSHIDGKKDLEDPTKLSINELRAKLYEERGDIDVSRKRMIDQLS
ncbi:hypothetical protein ACHAXR_006854 [Thalassiosira sp. AJA248-18]